jgi:hypothetical protein
MTAKANNAMRSSIQPSHIDRAYNGRQKADIFLKVYFRYLSFPKYLNIVLSHSIYFTMQKNYSMYANFVQDLFKICILELTFF